MALAVGDEEEAKNMGDVPVFPERNTEGNSPVLLYALLLIVVEVTTPPRNSW